MNERSAIPILYILMRSDINSMNPGKAMAQASHASNAFVYEATRGTLPGEIYGPINCWLQTSDQGFGTVIVLDGKSIESIRNTVEGLKLRGYVAGIVHDDTYPILDGSVVHHIPLDTCGYVFVSNKETDLTATIFLQEYNLHP